MVKSTLIFFDTAHQGRLGTMRGLVAVVPILLVLSASFLVPSLQSSVLSKVCGLGLVSLMLCSAIGVQLPTGYSSAVIYGSLVGLVVATSYLGLKLVTAGRWHRADFYLSFLVLFSCAVAAVVTRVFSLHFSLYPVES